MEIFILILSLVCFVIMVVGIYWSATADAFPVDELPNPIDKTGTYRVQVIDFYIGYKREYRTIFTGSYRAAKSCHDQCLASGHNQHTCRMVQVIN